MTRAAILMGLSLVLAGAHDARAVDCHSAKGAGHPWSWRQIDGKRCWYKGKTGIDKKRLRWPKPSTVGMAPGRPKPVPVASPNDPLLYSVWPPRDTFDDRFKGEPK